MLGFDKAITFSPILKSNLLVEELLVISEAFVYALIF